MVANDTFGFVDRRSYPNLVYDIGVRSSSGGRFPHKFAHLPKVVLHIESAVNAATMPPFGCGPGQGDEYLALEDLRLIGGSVCHRDFPTATDRHLRYFTPQHVGHNGVACFVERD